MASRVQAGALKVPSKRLVASNGRKAVTRRGDKVSGLSLTRQEGTLKDCYHPLAPLFTKHGCCCTENSAAAAGSTLEGAAVTQTGGSVAAQPGTSSISSQDATVREAEQGFASKVRTF